MATEGEERDYETQVRDAFPSLRQIEDDSLREKVVEAWVLGLERGGWKTIQDIPYAWNIHEITNVEHVRGVTKIALQSAEVQRDFHGADPDIDVIVAACLLHDVGKCYEYVDHVDAELLDGTDRERYASEEIPHSISGYALAHEVGCPLDVQRAIPHFLGEVPTRTLEAELVKSANSASSNAITESAMGITLKEWVDKYSQTQN
ncbi:HD domain-containing protein (plasmid) [Haloferax mediterranei ATCC 33500]|uniref:HD domain-containing protein n=1 Tax=Haloferax mediterranei (strain ATCC 33500 / DSM 1411 / JCM 8866 / NBRC 14739 / NCIMB 2177 / R-4) TaxID=523841 RepID=I3RAA1_HALMT|nr:HD domain-containing protein [Haloferax mediterranei]AFK21161.1 putative metal dependent phosphohydrolase [Haloferax mediterranei ATCC 33500]AHZ24720.1 phosphohydrolase [Haloferax mediterranei ATCC 33500]ELZ97503.1 putative metal dependent phosphohydrolase [Haloferax mediterranei ATCC 33500]MDX5990205.1 HD domain-containing protein [Haloferax mediterranei ATCC 33500]QCQ76726.1 HD domain-containing protein [Haloferax mediterranei ATCC 33500]